MNKKQFLTVCLSLLACLLAGCRDEMAEVTPDGHPDGSIVLSISTESKADTRTVLQGSHDLHHVEKVYAVLYQGNGDDAAYVYHQILTTPDGKEWNPKAEADGGQQQTKEFALTATRELENGTYTLLCVGLDDQSGEVYGLSVGSTGNSLPGFLAAGKKLSDAKAILASGKNTHEAELFAGWASFGYNKNAVNPVEVEMRRRVTGVYAFLKDIPVMIGGDTLKTLRLVLGQYPNSRIALARKELKQDIPDNQWTDYGDTPQTDDASKVLATLPISSIAKPNKSTGLYMIGKEYTEATKLPPFTVLMSAYILPQAENKLSIEVCGEGGKLLKTFAIKTESGAETIAFRPNHVYHIGTRDVDSERPVSLAGDRLKLEVSEWSEVTVDTEFPSVPLHANVKPGTGKNLGKYIYDCINTIDTLVISPSLLKYEWTLTMTDTTDYPAVVPAVEHNTSWLYFSKGKDADGNDIWASEVSSDDFWDGKGNEKEVRIPFIMNDYVVKHYPTMDNGITIYEDEIKNDFRTAKITLTTPESGQSDSIFINQYNAIQVQSKQHNTVGFSRFDFGVVRDKDGEVVEQGFLGIWGYHGTYLASVYDNQLDDRITEDGKFCYEDINKFEDAWGTDQTGLKDQPAVRFSHYSAVEYYPNTASGVENQVADDFWYLPARQELYDFFKDVVMKNNSIAGVGSMTINTNDKNEGFYWSATANGVEGLIHRSFCQGLRPDGKWWVNFDDAFDTRELRDERGYARRARHYAD